MKKSIILLLLLVTSGCSISQSVKPVDSSVNIQKIYVENNEAVLMKETVNEIVSQVQGLGFESESYSGQRPIDATHYITYTGNWRWDVSMYLYYFEAQLYENDNMIGEVKYDAKNGGASFNKFGRTADKIRPLLNELLSQVQRPTGTQLP